jgi:hypothetical protein
MNMIDQFILFTMAVANQEISSTGSDESIYHLVTMGLLALGGIAAAVILLMGIRFHLIWTLVSIIALAAGAAFLASGITNAAMIDYHTQWATESRHILSNIAYGAGLTVGGLILLIVSLVLHFTRHKKPHTEVATVPPAAK